MVTAEDLALPQLVLRQARIQPDVVAIDAVEGSRHSWAEYAEAGRHWAGALSALGVQPGDPILTMLPSSFEALTAWLACSWLGALEVPVNHAYRGDWLRGLAQRVDANVAVVHERFWPSWEAILPDVAIQSVVIVGPTTGLNGSSHVLVALSELLDSEHRAGEPVEADRGNTACVVHTSGTTGASKGVVLPWGTFHFRASNPRYARLKTDVHYVPFGSFHMSARLPWYEAALYGSRVCIRDGFKTDSWLADVRLGECTVAPLVGSMAAFLMSLPERDDDRDNPVRLALMGPLIPEVDEFKRRFDLEVTTGYGMTEIPHVFATDAVSGRNYRSVGRPLPNVTFRIVDDQGVDVHIGALGELLVGGDPDTVNNGYYKMPDATAAAWRDGWFHTGDLFKFDAEGYYYLVDRAKDALRRRGENISSVEVENVIKAHADVADCAIVAYPSEWSEDEVRAFIVPAAGAAIDPAELVSFVEPKMASFAVPRYIDIVDDLPRTPNLRVQKAILRLRPLEPATWDRSKSGT